MADGSVYVATINVPLTAQDEPAVAGKVGGRPPTGEIEALSLATGKVEWDTKVPTMPLGAATVSNDLVFTTLYNGALIALNRAHRGDRLPAQAADLDQLADRHRRQHGAGPGGRAADVGHGRRRQPAAGGLHGAVTGARWPGRPARASACARIGPGAAEAGPDQGPAAGARRARTRTYPKYPASARPAAASAKLAVASIAGRKPK